MYEVIPNNAFLHNSRGLSELFLLPRVLSITSGNKLFLLLLFLNWYHVAPRDSVKELGHA